jgi:hypothetical protein
MRTRMRTAEKRIDRSVKPPIENTTMKNWKNYLTLFPITLSKAEKLKSALVKRLGEEYGDIEPRLIHQAVNDADALASLTFAPLLLLPVLAEEKVQEIGAWSSRQRAVLNGQSLAFAV